MISSVESQRGVIAAQRCSIENQKGAIAVQSQWQRRPSGSQPTICHFALLQEMSTFVTRPFAKEEQNECDTNHSAWM